MLRNKLFLAGMGVGLIAAALLLQLMNTGIELNQQAHSKLSQQEDANKPDLLSDLDQVKHAAEKLGYALYTDAELQEMIRTNLDEELALLSDTSTTSATHMEESSHKIALYLSGGLSTEEIGHALELSGVIMDQNQFVKEVIDRNLSKVVRAGFYEFDGPLPVNEVIDKITGIRK